MNYLENSDTWTLVDWAITEFCKNHNICLTAKISKEELNSEIKDCLSLAIYSPADSEKGGISQNELLLREQNGELFSVHMFHRLEQHYNLREQMESCDLHVQRELLNGLFTHLPGNTYFPVDKTVITELLRHACALVVDHMPLQNPKELIAKAEAAKLLQEHGVKMTLLEGRFELDDDSWKRIFGLIEDCVKEVSGAPMTHFLYEEYLSRRYIPQMDRFIISRGETLSKELIDFPFRLLWNLSVKHFYNKPRITEKEAVIKTIRKAVELSNAWLRVMGLHERNAFHYAMMPATQFTLRLKEELLYDKFCIPEQYCERYVLLLLDHLIKPRFDDCFAVKYSYRDYRSVAAYVLKKKGGYREIDISALKRESKVSIRRIQMILEDYSWQLKEVNMDFNDLTAAANVTRRPLIKRPDGKFVFFDQHFCGIGFYLRAQELMAAKVNTLDRLQGPLLEEALKKEFKTCGIPYSFGRYPEKGGIKGSDCDIILEGDRVIFAEIKKSGCSQEFDIADDVGVLSRLGNGMLNAQRQCFHHEHYLRQNGALKLQDNNGNEHSLVLDERSLPSVKISICMSEYSFLTNKSFSKSIMEELPYVTYHPYDASRESEFDKINNNRDKILEYAHKDPDSGLIRIEELRSYTLFCSMQQILMAAWIWKDLEDMLLMIRDWRQTADAWLDPYYMMLLRIVIKENPEVGSVREHALKMLHKSHPEAVFILDA